mmetsp:Transcript_86500/g.224635  ORF Transcript_86500/g.224635 Transcript_86500/m.224635 type:complete len:310 (-) Transcript_86500:128-1057(-)
MHLGSTANLRTTPVTWKDEAGVPAGPATWSVSQSNPMWQVSENSPQGAVLLHSPPAASKTSAALCPGRPRLVGLPNARPLYRWKPLVFRCGIVKIARVQDTSSKKPTRKRTHSEATPRPTTRQREAEIAAMPSPGKEPSTDIDKDEKNARDSDDDNGPTTMLKSAMLAAPILAPTSAAKAAGEEAKALIASKANEAVATATSYDTVAPMAASRRNASSSLSVWSSRLLQMFTATLDTSPEEYEVPVISVRADAMEAWSASSVVVSHATMPFWNVASSEPETVTAKHPSRDLEPTTAAKTTASPLHPARW